MVSPHGGGCNAKSRKRIVNLQKRVIRTITKSYFSAHTEPRLKKLGLLKFEDLYEQQCLLLTHDCVNQKAPKKIRGMLAHPVSSNHHLRTAPNPLDLKAPLFRTRAAKNSFSNKGPLFWNRVPIITRKIQLKGPFKNAIKRAILEKYEHKSTCNNPRCRDRAHHN